MKKILSILLVLCLIGTAAVFAGGQKDADTPAEDSAAATPIVVSMATDVGGLGDKSFNDGAYAGLLMAQSKHGVEVRVVESKQQTDYVPNLSGLAEDGSSLVYAVGFLMEQAIKEAAANNPDTYFAGIDIWAADTDPANFQGISFNEHEAGYLAGVVAGMMTKEYASASDKLNDANVLGIVLGMFIPPVEKFEVGFIAGAKSVNPDVEIISVTSGSFVDQAKGKEAALAMIEQGADIIFHAAGLTGLGAINACTEAGVMAIGVDVDQNNVAPDTVLTSAEKKIVQATYLTAKSVIDGNFKSGNAIYGIQQDAVGISPFHGFDSIVPQAVKDEVARVTSEMKAGNIDVPVSRADLN
ncbi:MAG: BMP family ABC transporter substrate-binding protein [Spirochaetales bacterium]|nr:BMP family ABC transporter substrate-binding protein [Spirochaetales bacterium]